MTDYMSFSTAVLMLGAPYVNELLDAPIEEVRHAKDLALEAGHLMSFRAYSAVERMHGQVRKVG